MMLVLGSGFGLYGHAAALVAAGRKVTMPARYLPLAEARPEMKDLVARIEWVEHEDEALSSADGVCLARRPGDNAGLAAELVRRGVGGLLVIEKPIAQTAADAHVLEKLLDGAGRAWATPYLFIHCDWFFALKDRVSDCSRIKILWIHRQAASIGGWKKEEQEGGGLMAFYFIHVLAVLEALYPDAKATILVSQRGGPSEAISLRAISGAATVEIELRLGEQAFFEASVDEVPLFAAEGPFGAMPAKGSPDPRIPILQRFYRSLDSPAELENAMVLSRAVIRRWAGSEKSAQ